jgi:hypothetical protein
VPARKEIDYGKSRIVPRSSIFRPGIAEAYNQFHFDFNLAISFVKAVFSAILVRFILEQPAQQAAALLK